MSPLVKKVASEFEQVELQEIEADLAENEELMRKYDVRSLPTFILIDENGKDVGTAVGSSTEAEFRSWVNTTISVNA